MDEEIKKSKLAEKWGEKVSIAISQKENGQIIKIIWKALKGTFFTAWARGQRGKPFEITTWSRSGGNIGSFG